jgi:Flp pilus assembly protein TadG
MLRTTESNRQRFTQDVRGNVAILFGFAIIPVMLGVGVSVDYGRALLVRERMQSALDAATLAVGSWPGLSDAEMQQKAQVYFNANYPTTSNHFGTVSPLNLSVSGNKIVVSVSASVPTVIMRIVNIDHVDVGVSTTVLMGMGTAEVAIALDNSGSMVGSKIDGLKAAANDLVDTLFAAGQYSVEPDPIKIAIVPFAAGVNVGSQYANASWMDAGNQNPHHADAQKAYGAPSTTNNFTLLSSLKTSSGAAVTWGGCVEARPMPYDVTDDAPSNPSTRFVPMFAPDEPDNWTATTSNCTNNNNCTFACADGGSSCSSSSSTLVFNGAPPGSFSYNNYLPDAGDSNTCGNTLTVTSASPAVITKNNHGFVAGDQVIFTTTGALPTGLTKYKRYYILSTGLTTNSFRISTTNGGSAVNTSGSQSGTHFVANAYTCRSGDPNCARSGSSGKPVGQSEEIGFASPAVLTNSALCKYGTTANKATVANITVGGIPGGPNFMCTSAPVLPLSTDKTTIKNAINAMVAQGATGVGEGAAWGWRVLSPSEPFTDGRAYHADNNTKVLVLMTDGQNTYYPNSKFLKSWYDIYGYVVRNHLGTTSTNASTLTQFMDQRTLQICDNIKAAGIIIYTVAFQIPGDQAGALDLLNSCASDADKYFAPGTNSELLAAFNAIGRDITELRVSQ